MNEKDHHLRISHAERRIAELEQEIFDLKAEKSRMAVRMVELEAALIRLDSSQPRSIWDVNYF